MPGCLSQSAQQEQVDNVPRAVVDEPWRVVRVCAGMDLLCDLVTHRQADEVIWGRQPEPAKGGRGDVLGSRSGATFVRRYFDLHPSPRHTIEQNGYIKTFRLHQPVWDLNGLHVTAHELERSPRLGQGGVQFRQEPADVTANEAVDVLGCS